LPIATTAAVLALAPVVLPKRVDGARLRPPSVPTFPVDGPSEPGDGFGERPGGHDGVDLLADCGTPLVAMASGTVAEVDTGGAGGNTVVLRGRHFDDVYMHLERVAVRSGDAVVQGDRLGTVGDTGNATACHLHLERWERPGWHRGEAVDPAPALARARRP
jgi:murein DD-endopeptidase MepM/ murein hydrolase activator NlpD